MTSSTTGKSKMVAVNVLMTEEARAAIGRIMKEKKWSLAITMREAADRLIAAEDPEAQKPKKR